MRLSAQEDINLGIDDAFRNATDVTYLERQILRRGVEIVRTDLLDEPGLGSTWTAKPDWHGRSYPMILEISQWDPSESAELTAQSKGFEGNLRAEFSAFSRQITRMRVVLTIRASTFRDRMVLQSASLAKSRLSAKFSDIVRDFAQDAQVRAAKV